MPTIQDTCSWTAGKSIDEIDYQYFHENESKDGINLNIVNGSIQAMVIHSDGTNSNISFNEDGWVSDYRKPSARQIKILNSLANAGIDQFIITLGATPHHIMIHNIPRGHNMRPSIAKRIGLDAVKLSSHIVKQGENTLGTMHAIDGVSLIGAHIQYTCVNGFRHTT